MATDPRASNAADDEDEDDYLTMLIPDTTQPAKESSLQRTARLKNEAAKRKQVPSKAELSARARQAREQALATALDDSNKGARMMAKMGFTGGALGKTEDARTQPIELLMKNDRGGIGMDAEKKRKIREAAAEAVEGQKKRKVDEDEFRERNRVEREEKRAEGQWWGAMKILESYDDPDGRSKDDEDDQLRFPLNRRLKDVNVLYRPLLKDRLQREHEQKMRHDLALSLSQRHSELTADDDGEGGPTSTHTFDRRIDQLDDEDAELEEYEARAVTDRRDAVIGELRKNYHYCFWCKFRYEDEKMEGCPGETEDEHG